MTVDTHWNFQRCSAERVRVIVSDTDTYPNYWARPFVGEERAAVRVRYAGATFYIDDEDGSGWHKVTHGGGPNHVHRSLTVAGEVDG